MQRAAAAGINNRRRETHAFANAKCGDAQAPATTPTGTPTATLHHRAPPQPEPRLRPRPHQPRTTASAQAEILQSAFTAGLVTLPTDWQTWCDKLNWAKVPGILLSALLLSLGAPFWYGRLQDLLKLRSAVAQNDAVQRCIRRRTKPGRRFFRNAGYGCPRHHGRRTG